jgi:hypothetical protein
MTGNVFLHELIHDLVSQVSHAAGIASLHECNRFTLIVRRLADTLLRQEKYQDENRARPKVKKFHFYLRPSFGIAAHYRPIRHDQLYAAETADLGDRLKNLLFVKLQTVKQLIALKAHRPGVGKRSQFILDQKRPLTTRRRSVCTSRLTIQLRI